MNISTTSALKITTRASAVSFDVDSFSAKDPEVLVCKTLFRELTIYTNDEDRRPSVHMSGRGVKRLASGSEGTGERIIYNVPSAAVPEDLLAELHRREALALATYGLAHLAEVTA